MTQTSVVLNAGGVAVIPTDTLYGIVCRAEDPRAVERVYKIRKRAPNKPCIILIADVSDLSKFGISTDALLCHPRPRSQSRAGSGDDPVRLDSKLWPGPVSIILPYHSSSDRTNYDMGYLHRGTNTLAFRLPANEQLRKLLRQTGPLIAPSANPEGQPPAKNIEAARQYFGDSVDVYEDGGFLDNPPSTLIELKNGKMIVLRQGEVMIQKKLL